MGTRYNVKDADKDIFYRIPQCFLTFPQYADMNIKSMMLYGVLTNQVSLSRKNGWVDENGDIFFFLKWESIKKLLRISNSTTSNILKDLKSHGLLESVRQGFGMPDRLYLSRPDSAPSMESVASADILNEEAVSSDYFRDGFEELPDKREILRGDQEASDESDGLEQNDEPPPDSVDNSEPDPRSLKSREQISENQNTSSPESRVQISENRETVEKLTVLQKSECSFPISNYQFSKNQSTVLQKSESEFSKNQRAVLHFSEPNNNELNNTTLTFRLKQQQQLPLPNASAGVGEEEEDRPSEKAINEWRQIEQAYRQNIQSDPKPISLDTLSMLHDQYGFASIMDAIREAANASQTSKGLNYIKAILEHRRKEANGYAKYRTRQLHGNGGATGGTLPKRNKPDDADRAFWEAQKRIEREELAAARSARTEGAS